MRPTRNGRQKNSLNNRQRLSFRALVLIFSAFLFVNVAIFIILELSRSEKSYAATCSSSYSVDWNVPATYTVTCGLINSSSWTVKGDTCTYSSPLLFVGGVAGDPPKTVDLSVRINQSGNLTNNDFCWIYFWVNGVVSQSYIARGDTISNAVFYVPVTLTVPAGGTYKITVKFKDDKSNEFWEVKKGDIIACVYASGTPLPVTLTSFTGSISSNGALIKWTTEAEADNDYFTLLRSANANDYIEVARIAGNGTTSSRHNYVFTDDQLPDGNSYYKLSQTDFDGRSKTYGPIVVSKKSSSDQCIKATAFPNPFIETFTYSFSSKSDGAGLFVLCDQKGALLEKEVLCYTAGMNKKTISPKTALNPGVYYVGIRTGDGLMGFTRVVSK